MNNDILNRLKRVHGKFLNNKFDESDVCYFFMSIRENCNNSSLREIADFFAHRERNRGKAFSYMTERLDIFHEIVFGQSKEKVGQKPYGGKTSIDLNGIYDLCRIKDDINRIFMSNGMAELDGLVINDIMLFVLKDLIGCTIVNKQGKIVGKLSISFIGDEIHLNGDMEFAKNGKTATISIPVYTIKNFYTTTRFPKGEPGVFVPTIPLPLDGVYELFRENGKISILCNGIAL